MTDMSYGTTLLGSVGAAMKMPERQRATVDTDLPHDAEQVTARPDICALCGRAVTDALHRPVVTAAWAGGVPPRTYG